MSKNVQLIILHIAVAVLCFIGALVFFNNRMGMEKGSAVAELANPSYPVLEIGNDTSSYNLMAGYKEDIDLSLVRNQITLTNNKNAVILKEKPFIREKIVNLLDKISFGYIIVIENKFC